MNIVFDINKFTLGYTFFLEAKRNMIMDGIFSKIIYSNQFFTLNGIYLYLPIEIQCMEKTLNKNIIKFYANSPVNSILVQELSKIEYRIIEYYKQLNNITKRTTCLLSKQLYSGSLKLYKEYNEYKLLNESKPTYILKISGIWENDDEIGINYKVIESFPFPSGEP
jgi:hypothetical protein